MSSEHVPTDPTTGAEPAAGATAPPPAEGETPAPAQKKERFAPKTPVSLNPPKDDPISLEYLEKCDGTNEGFPTLVAIKGKVFDVTGNKMYGPDGGYKLFAGHDASRALAKTSLKPEDVRPEWSDLPETEVNTLNDWLTFFSKRYNIVGMVEGAQNL